jgi:hypothetical protein
MSVNPIAWRVVPLRSIWRDLSDDGRLTLTAEVRVVPVRELFARYFTPRRRYLLRARRKRHDFANGRPEQIT